MALRRGYFSRQDRASSALRFCATPIQQVEGKYIKKTKARIEKAYARNIESSPINRGDRLPLP